MDDAFWFRKVYFRSAVHLSKRQIRHLPEEAGATSMKTYLRKTKNTPQAEERGGRKGKEKKIRVQTPRSGAPMEDPMLEQVDMP